MVVLSIYLYCSQICVFTCEKIKGLFYKSSEMLMAIVNYIQKSTEPHFSFCVQQDGYLR